MQCCPPTVHRQQQQSCPQRQQQQQSCPHRQQKQQERPLSEPALLLHGTNIGTSAPTTTSPAATTTHMAPMAGTRPPRSETRLGERKRTRQGTVQYIKNSFIISIIKFCNLPSKIEFVTTYKERYYDRRKHL